jgi:antitoxin component of MazEF toxin-antitoxin module
LAGAGDGIGDIIVDIPPEIFDAQRFEVGDDLIVEVADGIVTLKPKRRGVIEIKA